ncbi:VOC family protein [Rhodococcus sp. 05-2256-B2]|uniref:VOC family protein n=1 Tax=Nocardiaceae TaxID=85025 RepID=UPI00050C7F3C|nr:MULTISPECIES: VOC family protein [Rhodococcus]MBY4382107.1 VOC family protein [Rhodococcus fascians]OZD39358.1 VOC family protein [Rhodococcus sp. 06-1477-1B]MBY4396976.1 VOC family protein [Rhodococcus fascians]MBY4405796.1 VOC family protein [Rhodococcus fascians]MBY4421734.1 VOC family protein [Rhodococcus fascians]
MPSFPGLAHVAITVSDLERSVEWYSRLFDSRPVLDEDEESGGFHHSVFALADGMLFGLHTHHGSTAEAPFDERRTGLDHIAFGCSQEELIQWRERLTELQIEHSGIKHAHYGSGISFRDQDNVALEFFAPPA